VKPPISPLLARHFRKSGRGTIILGAPLLTWRNRVRAIGGHLFVFFVVCGALSAPLYSQGAAEGRGVCSFVPTNTRCGALDAFRSTRPPGSEEISYGFSTGFCSSRQATGQNCFFACERENLAAGGFLSTGMDTRTDALRHFRVGGVNFWAWGQQNGSAAKNKGTNTPVTPSSPRHIFWVVPAFNVAYTQKFTPLTSRQKFDEWATGTYDPRGLGLYAFESATLEYSSSDGFCGYGKGWGGYGKCFGATELDVNISSFLGDFLFPVVMHQDPRYFRLGRGPFRRRLGYAVSRVFVTHADSGRTVFFASALSGSVIAAAASNLYYPTQDRGWSPTLSRMALDLGNTALFNSAAEFWPDIQRALYRALRRH
jgi:hypothetical protein